MLDCWVNNKYHTVNVLHYLSSLCSLKGRQESWQSRLEALPQPKTLLANCILAAALTTYCGALRTSARLQ